MQLTVNANHVGSSLTIDRKTLADLLAHAAAAARIVGHIDDRSIADPLADHVDAIVHELTELLGNPQLRGASNAAEPGRRDGAPMLTSGVGGIP